MAIADRVGHESIDITYRYSHLFPSKQVAMADKLDEVNASYEDGVQDEVAEDVAVNEIMEEKATSKGLIENDNKILNIQKYLAG